MATIDVPLTQGSVTIDGTLSASWSGGVCVGAAIFGGPGGTNSSASITFTYAYDPTGYVPSGATIINEEFMLSVSAHYDAAGGFDGGAGFSITGGGSLSAPPDIGPVDMTGTLPSGTMSFTCSYGTPE